MNLAYLLLVLPGALALPNGLAPTPQMGYNSWYDLMSTLTEENIKATADQMVELGLVELGERSTGSPATPDHTACHRRARLQIGCLCKFSGYN